MIPTFGAAAFIARTARQTRPSGFVACEPFASFSAGSTWGKTAMAGIPSFCASMAASAAASTESRSAPGIAATGTCASRPSCTTSAQMRSFTDGAVSRTRRRAQSVWRRRRRRLVGNGVATDMCGVSLIRIRATCVVLFHFISAGGWSIHSASGAPTKSPVRGPMPGRP